MRCPKCNQEINPHSERCPNCGTSAKYAVPDGNTMTRVRRQISVIRRENEVSDMDLSDASFSPVLKFDRPEDKQSEETIQDNPADNFPDESFGMVDLSIMLPEEADNESNHQRISASINHLINNKEDDLLAEYYFKDGITDLEKIQLVRNYERLEQKERKASSSADSDQHVKASLKEADHGEEEMSEAAKRLSEFPEEKGLDKFLTDIWEKVDNALLKTKKFIRRNITERIRRNYDRFDAKTSGFMNKALDVLYFNKFGKLKRKRADQSKETYYLRRKAWAALGITLVLMISLFSILKIMMTSDINGKWIISTDSSGSPNIIMEFKPGGSVALSVKAEDGWHIHKQGTYSTKRKNGHDMLTIVYDDGETKRLYYIVEGKSATFINVDTNVQVKYQLK